MRVDEFSEFVNPFTGEWYDPVPPDWIADLLDELRKIGWPWKVESTSETANGQLVIVCFSLKGSAKRKLHRDLLREAQYRKEVEAQEARNLPH